MDPERLCYRLATMIFFRGTLSRGKKNRYRAMSAQRHPGITTYLFFGLVDEVEE